MSDSTNWLVHDHGKYQAALEACEIAARAQEWKEAVRQFGAFVEDLKLHMRIEEEVLYPFFTQEFGDPQGEIDDLSYEHERMVGFLRDVAIVVRNRDFDHFEECLGPLYQAMTEHGAHEEEVFRRMGGHILLTHRDEILRRLRSIQGESRQREWEFWGGWSPRLAQ